MKSDRAGGVAERKAKTVKTVIRSAFPVPEVRHDGAGGRKYCLIRFCPDQPRTWSMIWRWT